MSSSPSERTPLLRASSQNNENGSINASQVRAAEVAQQGEGAAPQFPETVKRKSFPNGQAVVPNEDAATTQEEQKLVRFQKNGKLEGVGVWKFRCVFGGIVLGYFVSGSCNFIYTLSIAKKCTQAVVWYWGSCRVSSQ